MLWPILALTFMCTGIVSHASFEDEPERPKLPMKIGNTVVIRENIAHITAVVLDEKGTVHLLTVTGTRNSHFFRISKHGAVKQMLMYRGWPYILDKHHRVYTLDTSWRSSLKNKIPYMSARFFKTIPLALGTGLGVTSVGLIDQAFLNVMNSSDYNSATVFLGGVLAYYAADMTYTAFFRTHRSIGRGGNFFTVPVAKGIDRIEENPEYDDFLLIPHKPEKAPTLHLSTLVPQNHRGNSCSDYLTKLSLP